MSTSDTEWGLNLWGLLPMCIAWVLKNNPLSKIAALYHLARSILDALSAHLISSRAPGTTYSSKKSTTTQYKHGPAEVGTPLAVISWPGYGILFFWQLGILQYLYDHFNISEIPMIGSSAGALICTLGACGVDPKAAMHHAYDLCVQRGVLSRPWGLAGVWGSLVHQWLMDLLPDDGAQRCSRAATQLVLTRIPSLSTTTVSHFHSKQDLITVNLASAHIPWFLDWQPWRWCRGEPCIDGSFSYILLGRRQGLVPEDQEVVLFDPFRDKQLRQSFSIMKCLSLTSLEGLEGLMDLGYQYCERLHSQGKLPAHWEQVDAQVVMDNEGNAKED